MDSAQLVTLMIALPLIGMLFMAWGVRGPSLFTIRMWHTYAKLYKLTWKCIKHNPTRWGLGLYDSERSVLSDIIADTRRNRSGTWTWFFMSDLYTLTGNEPTNEWAMRSATDAAIADGGEETPC